MLDRIFEYRDRTRDPRILGSRNLNLRGESVLLTTRPLCLDEHREPEHFIGDEIKCTIIYLCPCVFFSRLEGICMRRRRFTFANIISRAAL